MHWRSIFLGLIGQLVCVTSELLQLGQKCGQLQTVFHQQARMSDKGMRSVNVVSYHEVRSRERLPRLTPVTTSLSWNSQRLLNSVFAQNEFEITEFKAHIIWWVPRYGTIHSSGLTICGCWRALPSGSMRSHWGSQVVRLSPLINLIRLPWEISLKGFWSFSRSRMIEWAKTNDQTPRQ